MKHRKVILSLRVADALIKQGFQVIEVRPSTKVRGNAAFIFELTPEFSKALGNIRQKL
ncbi:hypothetical protein M948_19350 [Virgibacillus sp. CM-4]|uniref:hypothetical protein n=1 Tax=Virgibacillus sp. CM-4 TaxID=1354277 RepID=UPI00038848DE|nr:hypothetical protein [Virgibacillus sp. CM-4]EQB35258.1 hypothetical protein M948_19350 [Virgibacillus sp. CM-4]